MKLCVKNAILDFEKRSDYRVTVTVILLGLIHNLLKPGPDSQHKQELKEKTKQRNAVKCAI